MKKGNGLTREQLHRREAKAARRRQQVSNGKRNRQRPKRRGLSPVVSKTAQRQARPSTREARQAERDRRPRLRDRLRSAFRRRV